MDNTELDIWRQHWHDIFDRVFGRTDVDSGVPCLSICEALCCPRRPHPSRSASDHVIFLPFELEYLSQTGGFPVDAEDFVWQSVPLTAEPDGPAVDVPYAEHCPFLDGHRCGIYAHRPIDCRTFPVLARRAPTEAAPSLMISAECPGRERVADDFVSHIRAIWDEVGAAAPPAWWALFEKLY